MSPTHKVGQKQRNEVRNAIIIKVWKEKCEGTGVWKESQDFMDHSGAHRGANNYEEEENTLTKGDNKTDRGLMIISNT